MVRVNFRTNEDVENHQIIRFFEDIGYEHIKSDDTTIKVEGIAIPTEVFLRNTKSGRYHLHITFGKKYSGTEHYPQVKVFAHFDIKKQVNGREFHFADRNEKRNIDEMYRIDKKMKKERLGFLEIKDRLCAHGTMDAKDRGILMEFINENYEKYDKGKYRKRMGDAQCTISLFDQENFVHIVCVYAKIVEKDHDLIKSKALAEIGKIKKITT